MNHLNFSSDALPKYSTMDQAWFNTVRGLLARGDKRTSRVGDMREIPGYAFRLIDIRQNWLYNRSRKASKAYAAAELLWYLSGEPEIDRVAVVAPSYKEYADDGRIANGAYGARWQEGHQFERIRKVLVQENTRQAVMSCWQPRDLKSAALRNSKDIPCTLTLQFLPRDGFLNLIVNMRSNDAWLGLPYDVWCFTSIQKLFANATGLKFGWYQHQAGSMHLYEKDADKATVKMHAVEQKPRPHTSPENWFGLTHDIRWAVEKQMDVCSGYEVENWEIEEDSLLADCLKVLETKFC